MAQLLSGSSGLSKSKDYNSGSYVGSLVQFMYKERYGIIIYKIDEELDDINCRYMVYYNHGARFGTFLDDLRMIQVLTGSQ